MPGVRIYTFVAICSFEVPVGLMAAKIAWKVGSEAVLCLRWSNNEIMYC